MCAHLNAHSVLKGTEARSGYLQALDLGDGRNALLRGARDEIRRVLRVGLRSWDDAAKARILVEREFIALASQLAPLRPRFRMQGSCVYHTLNDPAHKPPQEVDYDDGVFLPTSFISRNSRVQPMLAAKGLFRAVENALEPLCNENKWVLNSSKDTCVRIKIDSEAHVDLPLYAVPDTEFINLIEASARSIKSSGRLPTDIDYAFAEHAYKEIPHDKMVLAHRREGWVESDPRLIENWFVAAVRDHGEVVRRLSRYLKGWRDYQWALGGPSSIALMACVVTVFDEVGDSIPDNRDDLALKAVAGRLEQLFSNPIPNPVLADQFLDASWSDAERLEFTGRAAALKGTIDKVLVGASNVGLALLRLTDCFGQRIPKDHELVKLYSEEREILTHRPSKVTPPIVPRTTSG